MWCLLPSLVIFSSGATLPDVIYDKHLSYEEHADLCPTKEIQPAPSSGFQDIREVDTWVRQNQMCYFLFVNEAAEYPDILQAVVTKDSLVCFDPTSDTECEDPTSDLITRDINTLRGLVDIHEQEYKIVHWEQYYVKVAGKRGVRLEAIPIIDLKEYGIDTSLITDKKTKFEEEYYFNEDGTGTIKKRIIVSEGQLTKKLITYGIITYANFAKSVGEIFDFPQRFQNRVPGGNNNYIQLKNGVIIIFIGMVVFIVITMYLIYQLMKMCCCRKQGVYRYAGVKQTDVDTDTDSK